MGVIGSDLIVTFGRIGTDGQSKTKSFADAQGAIKERDKLVKEKTGKGYSQSGVASAELPVSSTEDASDAPAPAASLAVVPPKAVSPKVAARSAELVWPSGGFQWKDEWRQELPIVRGVHLPAYDPVPVDPLRVVVLRPLIWHAVAQQFPKMNAAAGGRWTYWGEDGARANITPQKLAQPDQTFWTELLVQVLCGDRTGGDLGWAVHRCVDLHGLPFTIEAVVRVWELSRVPPFYRHVSDALLNPLRLSIAYADEPTHAAALAAATHLRGANAAGQLACAYLFPHVSQWAEECLELQLNDAELLMARCVISPRAFAQALKSNFIFWFTKPLHSAIYLQLLAHGEAAVDVLAALVQRAESWRAEDFSDALHLVTRMHAPGMVSLLASNMGHKKVRDALEKLARQYPAAVLKCAMEQVVAGRDKVAEGWTVRLAVQRPEALAIALAAVDDKSRTRFQTMLATLASEEANADQLPPVLRDPPWLARERPKALPAFEIATLPTPPVLAWDAAQLARARTFRPNVHWMRKDFAENFGLTPAGVQRVQQGQWLQESDLALSRYTFVVPDMLFGVPEPARLAMWNSYPAEKFGSWSDNVVAIRALLHAYQFDALPGLLAYMKAFPDRAPELAAMVDSPALVDMQIHAMRFSKKHREPAARWVLRFANTVLHKAMPQAFHPEHSALRDNARHALRWLSEKGHAQAAREVAAHYGGLMPEALEALLAMDPLHMLPGKMPKLPSFYVAAAMRRPELTAGGALPLAAVEHVGTMLAMSQPDAPYPGLAIVKEVCTQSSLANFVWEVFQAWLTAGASHKEAWAFAALALLGDDDTARKLAPLIRAWPDQSAQARALAGLDVLGRIGSDVALMHLNALSTSKCKPLVKRISVLINAVAEARGLTTDELADRLVPDVGLDESGTLELDFGPRTFYLRFDETLEPFVKDAQGLRLKVFPRQQKTDDAALATAAIERFKHIRKESRATASQQVARMERAMVARRRWPEADFRRFFLDQPLMRHLTARLVWGVYESAADGARLLSCFRVAEDWTLADADDALWQLPDGATLGIPHVLDMPQEIRDAFTQTFADYEIAQPFRQLGRETYTLTADELQSHTISRFEHKVVGIGSVMGLAHRGWERGEVQGSGRVMTWTRAANDELVVEVQLDPGMYVGDAASEPRQRLAALVLRDTSSSSLAELVPSFSRLDPMRASEVLRDLELLSHAKD